MTACTQLHHLFRKKNLKIFISSEKEYLSIKKMNLNNTSAPPRHEATQDNDQPPKYEDIFGQRPSNEIAIEIPSQNENPQIQIQQARMVQVTIGRPVMPSQTENQQITSG